MLFDKAKKAHEVLCDPHRRAIYDTMGIKGLETDGWEVVQRTKTPQEIREEYERLAQVMVGDQCAFRLCHRLEKFFYIAAVLTQTTVIQGNLKIGQKYLSVPRAQERVSAAERDSEASSAERVNE